MKNFFAKIREFIKEPRGWFLGLIGMISLISLIFTIWADKNSLAQELFLAGISITSILGVYCIVILIIRWRRYYRNTLKQKLCKNKIIRKFLTDYDIKTIDFAFFTLIINVGFALVNGISAVRYLSVWYGALAVYYIVLIALRGSIMVATKKLRTKYGDDEKSCLKAKLKTYLASGIMLLILEIAMMAAVTQMVLSKRTTQSGLIYAIATAIYTFYKATMAIVNLVKARQHGDPITQSLRNINIADVCISIVSLTVLMITTIAEGGEMLEMKACVAFGAVIIVAIMAVGMIIEASKKLKEVNINERREE